MGKVVQAEYDAEHQTLRLLEPIEGFDDHEKMSVMVDKVSTKRPWMALADTLVGDDGERFERAIVASIASPA
jgi:hypothetical protein